MFSINFLFDDYQEGLSNEIFGEIVIGDFQERFISSLHYWNILDYQAHWTDALERVVKGADNSCLITNMVDPKLANFIVWWPIYRFGRKLIFHNQLLFINKKVFDPTNPYVHIEKFREYSVEGKSLSKWEISVDQIEEYLLKKGR